MTAAAETLILFGATGDLAQRMLLPSLFGLHHDRLVPHDLKILGTARSGEDNAGFREMAGQALAKAVPADQRDAISGFLDRLSYVPLDLQDPQSFANLSTALGDRARRPLAIFLSTAPALFQAAMPASRSRSRSATILRRVRRSTTQSPPPSRRSGLSGSIIISARKPSRI
jgi:glucose-6-phosphate 1-dehydrogenase